MRILYKRVPKDRNMQRKDVLLNIQLWKRSFTTVSTNTRHIFIKNPTKCTFLKEAHAWYILSQSTMKHKVKVYLPYLRRMLYRIFDNLFIKRIHLNKRTFLTTYSYRHMHLITRLYGISSKIFCFNKTITP